MTSQGLIASRVDFKVADNGRAHFTDKFQILADQGIPVLRRGKSFDIEVHFENGEFDKDHHSIAVVFKIVNENPDEVSRTKGVAVVDGQERFGWKAKTLELKAKSALIRVKTPPNTLVGEWKAKVSTRFNGENQTNFYIPDALYLLFNPWNPEDQVFMENEDHLKEYVLKDVGKIWRLGRNGDVSGEPWVYGQFDKTVLPACIMMLKKSRLGPVRCGDAVAVARAISYMVNDYRNPHGGVLQGHWDVECPPNDPNCVNPSEWPGSVPILERYMKSAGEKSVSFAHCWVFAGVVTTVCRALGIPVRPVTNVSSAQDINSDLTCSTFYDSFGMQRDDSQYGPSEKHWTFHVWNEVFMRRPDLPGNFGGWQAIDGTPLRISEGYYQCGPASVAAIKAGKILMNYDTKAFVAATNADALSWKSERTGQYSVISSQKDLFGKSILTQKVPSGDSTDGQDGEDVTEQYKFRDRKRRESLSDAIKQSPKARHVYNNIPDLPDNSLMQMMSPPAVDFGQSLRFPLKFKNESGKEMMLSKSVFVYSMYYNGLKGNLLMRRQNSITLATGKEETVNIDIPSSAYIGKLVGSGRVHAYVLAMDAESGKTYAAQGDTGFKLPKLTLKLPSGITVGQKTSFQFRLENPLVVPLTGCLIYYFGTGAKIDRTTPFRDISASAVETIEANFVPTEDHFTISVTFVCNEMVNLSRSFSM